MEAYKQANNNNPTTHWNKHIKKSTKEKGKKAGKQQQRKDEIKIKKFNFFQKKMNLLGSSITMQCGSGS